MGEPIFIVDCDWSTPPLRALGVQFDYESGSIGCLRSATAVCLYREGHQHREIMVPRSSGGIDRIGSSRSIQVIDLFWNYWREFSVCYG